MAVREILLLGNPLLYLRCAPVLREELPSLRPVIQDLHDTLVDFRASRGAGRAIAAPQIGVQKRLVYLYTNEPTVFINPVLDQLSPEMFELWDDCMSFPNLLVRVRRHTRCRVTYRETNWTEQQRELPEDLSELLQHECDHLDGILAVARAAGPDAFSLLGQPHPANGAGQQRPRPGPGRGPAYHR
jgi:peptide deformylase